MSGGLLERLGDMGIPGGRSRTGVTVCTTHACACKQPASSKPPSTQCPAMPGQFQGLEHSGSLVQREQAPCAHGTLHECSPPVPTINTRERVV